MTRIKTIRHASDICWLENNFRDQEVLFHEIVFDRKTEQVNIPVRVLISPGKLFRLPWNRKPSEYRNALFVFKQVKNFECEFTESINQISEIEIGEIELTASDTITIRGHYIMTLTLTVSAVCIDVFEGTKRHG